MTMRAGKSMTLPPFSTVCSNRLESEGRKTTEKFMTDGNKSAISKPRLLRHTFHYHLLPSWESVEVQIIFKSVMSFNQKKNEITPISFASTEL